MRWTATIFTHTILFTWPRSGIKMAEAASSSGALVRILSLSGLQSAENMLEVPLWQRSYRWGQTNQLDLFSDTWKLCQHRMQLLKITKMGLVGLHPMMPHSMNTVVLAPSTRPVCDLKQHIIVDGQQRIVTLNILIAALRSVSEEIGDAQKITRWAISGSILVDPMIILPKYTWLTAEQH